MLDRTMTVLLILLMEQFYERKKVILFLVTRIKYLSNELLIIEKYYSPYLITKNFKIKKIY